MLNLESVLMIWIVFMACIGIVGCGMEPQDRIQLDWANDDTVAVITTTMYSKVGEKEFKERQFTKAIECGEKDEGQIPGVIFIWENDCDISTTFKGRTRDWDNPSDDEDDRIVEQEDESITAALVGAAVGASLGKKKKKKTTYKPSTTVTRRVTKPIRRK